MKKQLVSAVFGLFLMVGAASAQIVVRIGPPPPRPVEVVPGPRHGFVWVPGFDRWNGRRYVWVHGHYARAPREGVVWVPGEWREERGGHVWHEGYWR